MATTYTRSGKFRYWQKFLFIFALALFVLLVYQFTGNSTLGSLAIMIFVISMWYGIMSGLDALNYINQNR